MLETALTAFLTEIYSFTYPATQTKYGKTLSATRP